MSVLHVSVSMSVLIPVHGWSTVKSYLGEVLRNKGRVLERSSYVLGPYDGIMSPLIHQILTINAIISPNNKQ